MNKRQIIILAVVLGLALLSLIIIQTSYLNEALQLKKAEFDFIANRSLVEIINEINARDKFSNRRESLRLNEGVNKEGANKDTIQGTVTGYTQTDNVAIDIMEYAEDERGDESIFHTKNDGVLKKSLIRYRKARKSELESSASLVSAEIAADYEFLERTVEERLKGIDVDNIIRERLKTNGISDVFAYAIKDGDRFVYTSPDYFNKRSDYMYSKPMYCGRDGDGAIFYLFYPERKSSWSTSLALLLPNIVVTSVLILCFGFCLFVIIRQKKLSAVKNDFINNMAHEFKTPLATISLAAQMLKDKTVQQTPQTLEHVAGIVGDESKRLTYQVEKVLQTALFTDSRMEVNLKETHLNALIEGLLEQFSLRVEDKKGKLTGYLDAKDDEVFADEVHITNVISNLLDNAIKYCEKAPEIGVYTRNRGSEILISVIDNGIGIAVKDKKMIFERFYRVSTGNLHNVKGFGLGLPYVKTIVEAHNGKVEVESSLGKGSCFDISLPLSSKKM
ncbi:two-component sensor histidine kinase [Bacteroidia bacterium]|nr:two-component sensor histidine kinase [Bacteroidia bacterium]